MAIAVSAPVVSERLTAGQMLLVVNITLDTSYPTGGSGGVLAASGLGAIQALFQGRSFGLVLDYLPGTDKLKCFWTGAALSGLLAEVANATNLSADVIPALILGTE